LSSRTLLCTSIALGLSLLATPSLSAEKRQSFIVYNQLNSREIDSASQVVLGTIISNLKNCKDTRAEITGHSDSSEAKALPKLSELRAKLVSKAIISQGISVSKLKVNWLGSRKLYIPSIGNHPLNRRVEITVFYSRC
jgi:outer membrane protein OmpA-like peptidoglycan-associated protein